MNNFHVSSIFHTFVSEEKEGEEIYFVGNRNWNSSSWWKKKEKKFSIHSEILRRVCIELIDSLDSRNANLFELRSLAWVESEIVACKNVDTDSHTDNSCS